MNGSAAAGSRRLRGLWFFAVCALIRFAAAHGQAPTEGLPAERTPAESNISVTRIPEYAERTNTDVRAIRGRMEPDTQIVAALRDLPEVAKQVDRLNHETGVQVSAGLTPGALDDVRRQWRQYKDQLSGWSEVITARLQVIEQDTARLGEIDDQWAKIAAQAQRENLPDAARAPIRGARSAVRETLGQLRDERNRLLATLGQVSTSQTQVSDGLAQLELAEQRLRRDLFTLDGPPLWTALPQVAESPPVAEALLGGLRHNVELLRTFLYVQRTRVTVHVLLVVLILGVTVTLSRRQRGRLAEETTPAVRLVLTRPISATLILAVLLNTVFYPDAPVIVTNLTALVVALIMLRLFRRDDEWAAHSFVGLVAVLFLIGGARRLLLPLLPLARLFLVAEDLLILAWLLRLVWKKSFRQSSFVERWGLFVRVLVWLAVGAAAVALVANCAGNTSLAILLTQGTIRSAFAGLCLLATERVIEGLLTEVIASPAAQRLHSIAIYHGSLRRRMVRATRIVMLLFWCALTLDLFAVRTPVVAAGRTLLAAGFSIGAVSFSVGGTLTVLLTLWVSTVVARVVRVVLGEDVLPRLSLPRGVPAAVSAAANYLVLVLGFIVALSAAGIDPGRVALVAGALSVGIGFGLQTVVNNFVSGLILLLERPIQVGDTIEIDTVTGQVRHIGIRASTIATFDGAEVIVPNAALISERVVNWTLSNFQRRVEITVGVAYGNEPARVLKILEGAARGLPDVLELPAPQAVFVGFGDSSLDFALRAWTTRQDVLWTIRSRIALAIHDALRAASIEIPFPQRDVYVKSPPPPPPKPADGE
jgi:potassium efflux system protein